MLLHHYPWYKAAGDGVERGLYYREPEHQLTMYSYVSSIWECMREGGGSSQGWGQASSWGWVWRWDRDGPSQQLGLRLGSVLAKNEGCTAGRLLC